jgi:hypothetical protein
MVKKKFFFSSENYQKISQKKTPEDSHVINLTEEENNNNNNNSNNSIDIHDSSFDNLLSFEFESFSERTRAKIFQEISIEKMDAEVKELSWNFQ